MAPAPASLKPIQPYLTKANEMKNADPVVSYYCNYWAVQYAISLGLKDPEANVFLASLLDSLEKTKASMAGTEAVTDEVVGKAYMENFAGNIFTSADDEERARNATRSTAAKFFAAAQFMEVLQCFGDLDKETSDKIKYAKFQCARILRALKAGEDPNARIPEVDDEAMPVLPYVSPTRTTPSQPSTQADEKVSPATPAMNHSPSAQPQDSGSFVTSIMPAPAPVKPSTPLIPTNTIASSSLSPSSSFSPGSTGPPVPPPPPQRHSPPSTFPPSFPVNPYSSPSNNPLQPNHFSPAPPSQRPMPQSPSNYYTSSPAPLPPSQPSAPRPTSNYYTAQPSAPPMPSAYQPPQTSSYFPPQPHQQQVLVDDEAIAKAQKHARWAISALNYEDVETAVKELKNALNSLGVRD